MFLIKISPLSSVAREFNLRTGELKLDLADVGFYGYGKYRLKLFDVLMDSPIKVSPYLMTLSNGILTNADSLWALSYFAFARTDEIVRRGLIERQDKILWDSIISLGNRDKELKEYFILSDTEFAFLEDNVKTILIFILTQIKQSNEWLHEAFRLVNLQELDSSIVLLLKDSLSNKKMEELIDKIDYKYISAGAQDLSFCIHKAMSEITKLDELPQINWTSKYGKIVIGTNGPDIYNEPPYLLIIDPAGADTYYSAATSSIKTPISISMDFGGNDVYLSDSIGIATGVAGYGILVDKGGDDYYSSKLVGVGTGIFGLGLLLDLAGDDNYYVDFYGEGAGIFGCGVLSDIAGNDTYTAFQQAQGFGFVKGSGILIDKAGNDTYIACDDTIKYPSPQTKEHNVSFAQGAGYGVRADFTDGHSLAGGIGMLLDFDGNDSYSCGVFGQGVGYWFGIGALLDYKGDDRYNGVWYVQGACAHFAIGVLIDSAGNDTYVASMNMAQGAGHDFSLGVLVEYEGDDCYSSPNLSLGAGNANGMGLFMDIIGNDVYDTHSGLTLGKANIGKRGSLRDYMNCIGIFFDGRGNDKYNEKFAGNNKKWNQLPIENPALTAEINIGCDLKKIPYK
ncbi:MAG: hypothetical protein HY769_00690 [Candidatus Stahlbacteria bacterium]|nr:hypothetical protein [Candidatus Stahlbacteria bacterium]